MADFLLVLHHGFQNFLMCLDVFYKPTNFNLPTLQGLWGEVTVRLFKVQRLTSLDIKLLKIYQHLPVLGILVVLFQQE